MNKFIFYRGHCLILPLPCLIKDCGNELDWAPGTISSQRGLYRWLDWMMVLTALFSVNRIPKVPPKIGGWASNCFIHWWSPWIFAKGLVFLDGVGSIMIDFPGAWQFEDVRSQWCVTWNLLGTFFWWGLLHGANTGPPHGLLGEKGMRKIPFKSDSNRKYSALSTNHHCWSHIKYVN